jgi:hypothetical protein
LNLFPQLFRPEDQRVNILIREPISQQLWWRSLNGCFDPLSGARDLLLMPKSPLENQVLIILESSNLSEFIRLLSACDFSDVSYLHGL